MASAAILCSPVEPAPERVDSVACHQCKIPFSYFQRKKQCRGCGHVFCAPCTPRVSKLPKFGIDRDVRVCNRCYDTAQKELPVALTQMQVATLYHFMNQVRTMHAEKRLTDVSIVVGSKQFSAHKIVLAARSRVFAAMFEHDFVESAKNRVVITDFESDVVEKFVDYLYMNECDLEDHAMELLACAEKYGVEELKSKCEEILVAGLKCENAATLLQVADCHKAFFLKEEALKCINENLEIVINTPEWASVSRELLNEVLVDVAPVLNLAKQMSPHS